MVAWVRLSVSCCWLVIVFGFGRLLIIVVCVVILIILCLVGSELVCGW